MKSRLSIFLAFSTAIAAAFGSSSHAADSPEQPNILWITSEDNGPHLGCYGDEYADTPNLDRLAKRGMIYLHAWSNAPVCAPARTTIISGLYPPCTGAEHMRSMTRLPDSMKMYPQYLREAGYYCTNNSKEDYNLQKPPGVWDESSGKAHWRNRKPGQPFFAIFNFTVSHESQLRKRPHTPVHDPAKVRVPAYHPDVPEVRRDWAQYYDKLTEMDQQCGRVLAELEKDGLADSTIIFYYGDHGSGMPRNKRWPYNSGLHVPMIVHVPPKFQRLAPNDYETGGKSERLVSFIDLAPTVLSLAGVKPPEHLQGHAFMGAHQTHPPQYMFGFRGRMDERYDMVRSVTDGRYVYIRQYMPHKVYGQHIDYMFQTPTTQVWNRLFEEGKLNEAQSHFWRTKPPEELYDLRNDPDEVNNLASSAEHQEIRQRLRTAQQRLARDIRDIGFLPEDEIHRRAGDDSPYEMGHDPSRYPMKPIMEMAELSSMLDPDAIPKLVAGLQAEDSAVRYWAALGLLMRGESGVTAAADALRKSLGDESPSVQIIAAEALGRYGSENDVQQVLPVLLKTANMDHNSLYVSMLALNAVDALGDKATPILGQISELPRKKPGTEGRLGSYVPRLIDDLSAGATK